MSGPGAAGSRAAAGLACNSVADADSEPDLFWAVRGGGGSFAIVTALEFTLYPVAEVYAGALFWPLERAGEVIHTWRELIAAAPVELTENIAWLRDGTPPATATAPPAHD